MKTMTGHPEGLDIDMNAIAEKRKKRGAAGGTSASKIDTKGPTMASEPPAAPQTNDQNAVPTKDAVPSEWQSVLLALSVLLGKIRAMSAEEHLKSLRENIAELEKLGNMVTAYKGPRTKDESDHIRQAEEFYKTMCAQLQTLDKPDPEPTGHTVSFMASGDAQSDKDRAEQARLDAEEAARPRVRTAEEVETTREPRMSTAQFKKKAGKSQFPKILSVVVVAICVIALLGFGINWLAEGPHDRNGVAVTVAEAPSADASTPMPATVDAAVETAEVETPMSTPMPALVPTVTVTVATPMPAPVVETAPMETPMATPTVAVAAPTTAEHCRAGSEVASCARVTDFLLFHAEGEAYWNCRGLNAEQYRDMYTIEDQAGERRIVANTCACLRCEPEPVHI